MQKEKEELQKQIENWCGKWRRKPNLTQFARKKSESEEHIDQTGPKKENLRDPTKICKIGDVVHIQSPKLIVDKLL